MNLPENWTYKNIEEIAEVVTGSTPSKKHSEYYENEFPFYKPTDLNAGYYSKKSADGLSKLGLENARFIPEKSILVTSIGATMNILNLGIIKDLPFPFLFNFRTTSHCPRNRFPPVRL